MNTSTITPAVRRALDSDNTTKSDIRNFAKQFGGNHALAERLWQEQKLNSKLLAILVMERKQITAPFLQKLIEDMESLSRPDQETLCDWLLANQLMYIKRLYGDVEAWMKDSSLLKQRMFWSYQARMMRKEKGVNEKAEGLLQVLEKDMGQADPFIQGSMNWCAAQIGIYDKKLRNRCIVLGRKLGLYKDYPVSKGCTSPYLPEWIAAEVAKLS